MWQWFKGNGPGFSALAAVVAASVGIWAIVNAKRDSRDRSRPVMLAELQFHPEMALFLMFVVRNAGVSIAHSVKLQFDPPLPPATEKNYYPSHVQATFAQTIPTFGPGQSLANPWHSPAKDRPEDFRVTITYLDGHGREYSDAYDITVTHFEGMLIIGASSSVSSRLKALTEESKNQTNALRAIAENLEAARPN